MPKPIVLFLGQMVVEIVRFQRGQNVSEKESYENFKTKILEAVKTRKLARRSRKESFSRRDSVGSNCSMKRGLVEQEGTESSRAKLEIL